MKITIRTTLVEYEIEDEPTIANDGYTKLVVPEVREVLQSATDNAIRLHKAALESKPD